MGQYLHFYIWLILICGLWVDIPRIKVGWYVLLWKHCYNQKGESDSPNLESFAFFIWAKASGKCECHLRPPSRWTCKEHCSLSHSEKGGAETGSFVVYGHFDRLKTDNSLLHSDSHIIRQRDYFQWKFWSSWALMFFAHDVCPKIQKRNLGTSKGSLDGWDWRASYVFTLHRIILNVQSLIPICGGALFFLAGAYSGSFRIHLRSLCAHVWTFGYKKGQNEREGNKKIWVW